MSKKDRKLVSWVGIPMSIGTAVILLALSLTSRQSAPAQSLGLDEATDYLSRLRAEKVVVLYAEVNGKVKTVHARPQDFVKTGDVLLEFDSDLVDLQVARIQKQLELSTAKEEAAVNLAYSSDVFEIVEKLYNTPIGGSRASSEKEFKEAQQRKQIAELGERKARLEAATLQNDLEQNKILQRKHVITAPMNGVIVPFSSVLQLKDRQVKPVEAGEMISAGGVVMAMMKVDRLRVSHWVSYRRLDEIRLGQEAQVYVLGYPDPIPAKIVYISPTIEELGDQFTIEVEFENPEINWQDLPSDSYRYRFRPAMKARVEI